jgi:two-component system chemotaxis sensor kinase CheA
VAFDIAKYRALFLDEGGEHLAEMSSALLALEKDLGCVEAIDVIFRMAHSIKSMAASLGYDSISEVSHRLEDRMEKIRSAARVADPGELRVLFLGLEALEQMVEVVRTTGEAPPLSSELIGALSASDAVDVADSSHSPEAAQEGGQAKKLGS